MGEVVPEGDMTPKILSVPLPHHPSSGSPPGGIKVAFSRFFLSFNPDQFTDPSLIESSGQHRGAGSREWAGVPGQNYTVQTVLVQPVPPPTGSNSSQIPWLGPRKSLELRARSSHSPAP